MMKRSSHEVGGYTSRRSMYLPSPTRGRGDGGDGDGDLDNIDYRDDEEDENPPVYVQEGGGGPSAGSDEEVDPLDAFMAGIEEKVKMDSKAPLKEEKQRAPALDLDEEDDPMESFLAARRDAGLSLAADALQAGYDSDQEVYAAAKAVDAGMVDYDSDDNAIVTVDKRKIEPLPPLDHSSMDYDDFARDFYEEHPEITALSEAESLAYRKELGIHVSGFDLPRPIKEFEHAGLEPRLLGAISKAGYKAPTSIQAQAWPIILSGRDVIGVAKTGSGKTAAFVIPLLVHIMDQRELRRGEGPIGLVCAPTRELAQQIHSEAKKFARPLGIRVCGVFGGMSKFEQFKELKAGCEVLVATPGRLIDMLKMKALTMARATMLVLDEADRMFDMGFEPQVRSIVGQIRPDRQTLLFSATMPRRVERLARDILSAPVRITVGEAGRANEDITQLVEIVASEADKMTWLGANLARHVDDGDVVIFCGTRNKVEEVQAALGRLGFRAGALHGERDQAQRAQVLQQFKSGTLHVLVATDIAARGLDIRTIKTVINYDHAKDMDAHVHRIGRTGRAGDKDGTALTLLTPRDARFAAELVPSLVAAGQDVPLHLTDLAMKDGRFKAQREGRGGRGGKGRKGGSGGGRGQRGVDFGLGLGYGPAAAPAAAAGVQAAPARSKGQGSQGSALAPGSHLRTGMMAKFRTSFVAASSSGGDSASYSRTMQPSSGVSGTSSSDAAEAPWEFSQGAPGGITEAAIAQAAAAAAARAAAVAEERRSLHSGAGNSSSVREDEPGLLDGHMAYGEQTQHAGSDSHLASQSNKRHDSRAEGGQRQRRRPSGWDR